MFLLSSFLLLFCFYSASIQRDIFFFSALIMLQLGMFLLSYFQLLFCFYSARNLLFFSSYYARTRHGFLETFFHVFPCYARNRHQISFLEPPIFGRVVRRYKSWTVPKENIRYWKTWIIQTQERHIRTTCIHIYIVRLWRQTAPGNVGIL